MGVLPPVGVGAVLGVGGEEEEGRQQQQQQQQGQTIAICYRRQHENEHFTIISLSHHHLDIISCLARGIMYCTVEYIS